VSNTPGPQFEFSGGPPALDFANTLGDRARPETEKLGGYADLVAFAEQAGILDRTQSEALAARAREQGSAAAAALETSIDLREAVYGIFSRQAAGESAEARALELLSATVAWAAARLHLEPEGSGFAWRWLQLETSLEGPLAPIAWSAAELMTGTDLSRVRECDGDGCTWLFLDTSRNRSRRWCSMNTCGNRAKARRHYHRVRTGERPGS